MIPTVGSLSLGGGTSPAGRHVSDAVLEVGDLVDLYRRRDATRDPVGQQDLTLVERAVRTEVANHLLVQRMPRLVAELLDAAADDVSADTATDIEKATNADLRVFEAVERCKAVLDAVGLEALARLQADIEASERARFAELGGAVPPGWLDAAELTTMEVTTATGLGSHDIHARLSLATAPTATAAELRWRLRAGSVTLHRASTIYAETRTLPDDAGLEIVDAVLREKDGAPPSSSLFRQRLSRACLAADREAAERRREARRRRRGAYAEIDPDGLGALHVTNDADKIIASMERVDAIARAARLSGDSRNLDALRADVITDILMFGWPSPSEMPAHCAGDAVHGRCGRCGRETAGLGRHRSGTARPVSEFSAQERTLVQEPAAAAGGESARVDVQEPAAAAGGESARVDVQEPAAAAGGEPLGVPVLADHTPPQADSTSLTSSTTGSPVSAGTLLPASASSSRSAPSSEPRMRHAKCPATAG